VNWQLIVVYFLGLLVGGFLVYSILTRNRCKNCKGNGYIIDPNPYTFYGIHPTCPVCEGTGKVADQ
jgi:hypothetical protein